VGNLNLSLPKWFVVITITGVATLDAPIRPPNPSTTQPQELLKGVEPTPISVDIDGRWRREKTLKGSNNMATYICILKTVKTCPGTTMNTIIVMQRRQRFYNIMFSIWLSTLSTVSNTSGAIPFMARITIISNPR